MTVTTQCLYQAQTAPTAQTTIYGPVSSRTIIDKVSTYGVAAGDLTINLVAAAGAAGATNVMEKKTHAVGESYTWPGVTGHTLNPGDLISVIASAGAQINLRVNGRSIT